MTWYRRRTRLPDDLRARLGPARRDTTLAVAALRDGTWAVASRRALTLLDTQQVHRHSWTDVDHAELDPEAVVLAVAWVDGSTTDVPLDATDSAAARSAVDTFAQVVRERVTASVVATRAVTLPGGEVVRAAVRRDPDGALVSQVIGRVDLADPAVAAVVDAAERQVRETAGMTP